MFRQCSAGVPCSVVPCSGVPGFIACHQIGTCIYNASKVIAKYLKPLAKNEFTISGTLTFSDLVKCASNSNEYENISYDVEPLSQVY